jgi:hypothetical protein
LILSKRSRTKLKDATHACTGSFAQPVGLG